MFRTINEITQANEVAGYHFFEKETIDFFDSKIHPAVYPVKDGGFFVTSERFTSLTLPNGRRLYTIRIACSTPGANHGCVRTVGKFQGYESVASARRAIEALRDAGETYESLFEAEEKNR